MVGSALFKIFGSNNDEERVLYNTYMQPNQR